jgi:uncharacterized membrane protein
VEGRGLRPSYLVKGFPGHPLHPPLTDATIGIYTLAATLGVLSALGVSEENATKAWWLALVVGLVATVPTAVTGTIDWLDISPGTPLWRTATLHGTSMFTAAVVFFITAIVGHGDYLRGEISTGPLVLTLAGFALLTLGGWLGGTVVFVHGMRVLNLAEEPSARAITPGRPEKERVEQGDEPEPEGSPSAPGAP